MRPPRRQGWPPVAGARRRAFGSYLQTGVTARARQVTRTQPAPPGRDQQSAGIRRDGWLDPVEAAGNPRNRRGECGAATHRFAWSVAARSYYRPLRPDGTIASTAAPVGASLYGAGGTRGRSIDR